MGRSMFGIQTHSCFLLTNKALVGGRKLIMSPNTPPLIIKKNHSWKYFNKYFHSQMCQWLWMKVKSYDPTVAWSGVNWGLFKVKNSDGSRKGWGLWLDCFSEQFLYHVQGNSLLEEGSQGHTVPACKCQHQWISQGKCTVFQRLNKDNRRVL